MLTLTSSGLLNVGSSELKTLPCMQKFSFGKRLYTTHSVQVYRLDGAQAGAALKVVLLENALDRENFQNEVMLARMAAAGDNVALAVNDSGICEVDGDELFAAVAITIGYIAMPFFEKDIFSELRDACKAGLGPFATKMKALQARGVDLCTRLYDAGIVHNDAKGNNMAILHIDGRERLVFIDFGRARKLNPDGTVQQRLGTYDSPMRRPPRLYDAVFFVMELALFASRACSETMGIGGYIKANAAPPPEMARDFATIGAEVLANPAAYLWPSMGGTVAWSVPIQITCTAIFSVRAPPARR